MLWKPPPKEKQYGPFLTHDYFDRPRVNVPTGAIDEMLASLDRIRGENKALVAEVERLRVLLLAHGVEL